MIPLRAIAALALLLAPALAFPFHEGGVGACEGCHAMHVRPTDQPPSPWLLLASDQSSVCLNCHAGSVGGAAQYQVLTSSTFALNAPPPTNYTPGGDFGWLNRSYTWQEKGQQVTSPGASHGHNVTAADHLLEADYLTAVAPGGSYPSSQLSCISCHDPHGRFRLTEPSGTIVDTRGAPIVSSGSYGGTALATPEAGKTAVGVYRLLGGVGYVPKSAGAVPIFSSNPPMALAPQTYNQSERTAEVRVAYGAGMSEWCRNCHPGIHPTPPPVPGAFGHPAGNTARLNAGGALAIYNSYIRSGVLTGTAATSYLSLVPYEEGMTSFRSDLARRAASDGSVPTGPTTGYETVMCLSCHRAHASGWDHALRWNGSTATGLILVDSQWPGTNAAGRPGYDEYAQGRTQAETRAAMYDREPTRFGDARGNQKVLCNKCHGEG